MLPRCHFLSLQNDPIGSCALCDRFHSLGSAGFGSGSFPTGTRLGTRQGRSLFPRPAPLPSGQAVRTATHTYAEWIDPQGQTVLRQLIAHGGDGSMEITTLHPGEKSPLIESLAQCLRPAPPLHEK